MGLFWLFLFHAILVEFSAIDDLVIFYTLSKFYFALYFRLEIINFLRKSA